MKSASGAILVCLLSMLVFSPSYAAALRYGLDILEREACASLKGSRVGLITNKAGVSSSGESNYRLFLRHGVDLRFLMAPEHGFNADVAAGAAVRDSRASDSLKVYSLYGATKKPDRHLLETIDVLVFDLQDIGTRCYTYISTMFYAMKAAEEAQISFMVLDRPNPIAPVPADGFQLDPAYRSFVGIVEVPFIHGMTVGELAYWMKKNFFSSLSLDVIRMEGYDRRRFGDELPGFRFISPSPNIGNVETALVYPATVLLEATNISEGRGTDLPFRQFGAVFVDPQALKRALDDFKLPGVQFTPVSFRPSASKYKGLQCGGVRLEVTDRLVFEPFRTGVAILVALHDLYPRLLDLESHGEFFDKLAGTPLLRRMLLSACSLEEILAAPRLQVHEFEMANPDRFIYP